MPKSLHKLVENTSFVKLPTQLSLHHDDLIFIYLHSAIYIYIHIFYVYVQIERIHIRYRIIVNMERLTFYMLLHKDDIYLMVPSDGSPVLGRGFPATTSA